MRYIPNSPEERQEMLKALGFDSAEQLFDSIPEAVRLGRPLQTPDALSETELLEHFERLAALNSAARRPSFLGAGAYSHYAPTIIDSLIQRSEFFTAYTPYQPEISQGTLQAIFEFQTLVCQLTGMDVANASMYDGSTAMAEAALMAERVTRRRRVLVSGAAHPEYLKVAETYVAHAGVELRQLGFDEATGRTNVDDGALDETVAAVVVQSPNFFGCVEDLKALSERAHAAGALLVAVVTESASFGLLRSPGACGADIVVAEGQSFGVPLSYGGPYVGLFATREQYARQLPGRLAGVAYDKEGRRGFVLTLATREQHIRREKATSNICTNSGLCALAFTIHMTLLGGTGLRRLALINHSRARELKAAVEGAGLEVLTPRFFNEIAVRTKGPAAALVERLLADGIVAGVPYSRLDPHAGLDDVLLMAATETTTTDDIAALARSLAR